jgi:mercuric ion binding protein
MRRLTMTFSAFAGLGLSALATFVCVTSAEAETTTVNAATTVRTDRFTIKNMTCAACPITVRTAMEHVDGVKSVKVNFEAKTATAVYDPSITTSEAIAKASTNAGYPATPAR